MKLKVIMLLVMYDALGVATPPLILKPAPIGSDWTFNPASLYLNTAFDTTQNPTWFNQAGYFGNHGVLWRRVRDPFAEIDRHGGWGEFLRREIIGIRAIPNYSLHLFGGGYDFRWLAEWYENERVPYPYVLAFVTTYLANIGNEALETSASEVAATDHIADLYVFDIAGKILFTNDAVVRFMRDTMRMHAWHFQPMLNLRHFQIDNAAANYVFRPRLFGERFTPFFFAGLTLLAGISWRMADEDSLTIAAGAVPTNPLKFEGDPVVAFFWDRSDSLLASLTLNGSSNLRFRLNLYPDFVPFWSLKTGLYTAWSKTNEVYVGVNLNMPVGVSASF